MEATGESPAQRQIRIRREKREKKILEGGSARLDKITSLSGRPAPSDAPAPHTQYSEVDRTNVTESSPPDPYNDAMEAEFGNLLRSSGPPPREAGQSHNESQRQFGQVPGGADQEDMMKLLQQMMGGIPPGPSPQGSQGNLGDTGGLPPGLAALLGGQQGSIGSGGGGSSALPPGLAAMLGQEGNGGEGGGLPPGLAAMLGGGGGTAEPSQPAPTSSYIWKILHAFFSITLGIYILYSHPFSGSHADRSVSTSSQDSRMRIFWAFATVELALQSSRYLLDKGRNEGGMMMTVANFLPQPWNGRLRLVNQYSGIWTTLSQDAMVTVFVVGVAAWWRGEIV